MEVAKEKAKEWEYGMMNNELEPTLQLGIHQLKMAKTELTRFMMAYKFALDEINTKIDILKQEFHYIHDYNPIEHVTSRLKTPESILQKMQRKGLPLTLEAVRENIQDIAGIRITCSFSSDIYVLADMLKKQHDLKVLSVKDYIEEPKPNGYKSLHLILQVPIFMSDRVADTCVEIQIRTIAMDFWASLEHKIYYKYEKDIPARLSKELKEAADTVAALDQKMERIHQEMAQFKQETALTDTPEELVMDPTRFQIPYEFLSQLMAVRRLTNSKD